MTRVIWKYDIPPDREFTLEMPAGVVDLLDVQMQDGQPRLWVCVNAHERGQRRTPHHFRVVPTGLPFVAEDLDYVGTFQPEPGLVFHLFHVRQS